MRVRTHPHRPFPGLLSVCAVAVLVGGACQKTAPAPTSAPVAIAAVLKTPEDATRSLVEVLRAHLDAVAHDDRARANALRDQAAEQLLAREDILSRYHRLVERPLQSDESTLRGLVENWAAILSYYIHGLELAQMKRAAHDPATGTAAVDVPAHGPDDEALLRVTCRRGPDEQWRVSGIDLPPPRTASKPTSTQAAASRPTGPPG